MSTAGTTTGVNVDVDRYLARIGVDPGSMRSDLDGLTLLQHAHLATVPFENLDLVFADGVAHDRRAALAKIVDDRRGGWCFELNGAFGRLLEALGFDVSLLGAAVLLDGPSTVLEHLALEVSGGVGRIEPHFVDVGFGDSTRSDRSPSTAVDPRMAGTRPSSSSAARRARP